MSRKIGGQGGHVVHLRRPQFSICHPSFFFHTASLMHPSHVKLLNGSIQPRWEAFLGPFSSPTPPPRGGKAVKEGGKRETERGRRGPLSFLLRKAFSPRASRSKAAAGRSTQHSHAWARALGARGRGDGTTPHPFSFFLSFLCSLSFLLLYNPL